MHISGLGQSINFIQIQDIFPLQFISYVVAVTILLSSGVGRCFSIGVHQGFVPAAPIKP